MKLYILDLFDLLKNVRNKIRLAMYVVTNITLLGAWSMALGLWLPFEYFFIIIIIIIIIITLTKVA